MTACQGLFGRLLGHDYQPRYSETQSPVRQAASFEGIFSGDMVRILTSKDRIYHGDVCSRCGGTLTKKPVAGSGHGESQ